MPGCYGSVARAAWPFCGEGPRPNFLLVWAEGSSRRESGEGNPFLGSPPALGGAGTVLALGSPNLILS